MKLSALILTSNEGEMIADCLAQLDFVDEVIILDQDSRDNTIEIAKKFTEKIYQATSNYFDQNRNTLLEKASGNWLLYIDADERLDEDAIMEIKRAIKKENYDAFYFPRKNIILGKWLKHGGWWPDYVPRLFKREKLLSWRGRIHESPKVNGNFGYFQTPLTHLTARSLEEMFTKSIKWAKIEAELFYEADYPKVTATKIVKAMIFEFFTRFFLKIGFADGIVGLIESVYQSLHKAMVFTYLWELQNEATKKTLGLKIR